MHFSIIKALRRIWMRILCYPEKFRARIDGFTLILNMRDKGISRSLYYDGTRERAFMSILQRTVEQSTVCLDIGANIGYTSLYMLRHSAPDGFVYSIEPDPHNIALLEANISANGYLSRCLILQGAISDHNGEIDFWLADRPNVSGVEKNTSSVRKIQVKAYDFPSFMEGKRFPGFIKMDVEGHEVKILSSALSYFASNAGAVDILLEVHPAYYGPGNDFEAVLLDYFRSGFSIRYVISTPVAQPTQFAEAGYVPVQIYETDGFERGIYENITNSDLLKFLRVGQGHNNSIKIIRALLISRP
jgi:FkbM family methyltransferase